jgi:hypothetical protein
MDKRKCAATALGSHLDQLLDFRGDLIGLIKGSELGRERAE